MYPSIRSSFRPLALAFLVSVAGAGVPTAATAQDAIYLPHAIGQYGYTPEYPEDFPHWNYVNPDAPKGGEITLGAFGTFDSFNNLITQGTPATGLSLIYDRLLTGNSDELLAYYLGAAESYTVSDDGMEMTFTLREGARFHDGHPMTADDIVFTHRVLEEDGAPRFRARFYGDLETVEALDDRTVRFVASSTENPELLLSLATFPILPEHYYEGRDFASANLDIPLGSGPYRIAEFEAGRQIVYERVEDYWAQDLPANVGSNNFDRIVYDYYRDVNVMFEAFKAGEIDFMSINSSQEWSTGFDDIGAVDDGELILEEIASNEPEGFNGILMNLRREPFNDPLVREALIYFYDWETARQRIHFGLYTRTNSWFPNTEFVAATGLPEGREREILEARLDRMPPGIAEAILDENITLPTTDGSGNIRSNLRAARDLFAQAGWVVRDGRLVNEETGEPMTFEIMFVSPNIEKVVNDIIANFERGGIEVTARLVDPPQYIRRMDAFDFDMVTYGTVAFYPPGQTLRGAWRSEAADEPGNENASGIQDPVLDELVELAVAAETWDEKVATVRALDRYLMWQRVAIPTYYNDTYRIGYWDVFDRPETRAAYGIGFPTVWWYDPTNADALPENR